MYPIKARNGSVFEPNKAPSVGLTLGLLDRPFGLLKLRMFGQLDENPGKAEFSDSDGRIRTSVVGFGQYDQDQTRKDYLFKSYYALLDCLKKNEHSEIILTRVLASPLIDTKGAPSINVPSSLQQLPLATQTDHSSNLIGIIVLGHERGMTLDADYLEALLKPMGSSTSLMCRLSPRNEMAIIKGFASNAHNFKKSDFFVRLDSASVAESCNPIFRCRWSRKVTNPLPPFPEDLLVVRNLLRGGPYFWGYFSPKRVRLAVAYHRFRLQPDLPVEEELEPSMDDFVPNAEGERDELLRNFLDSQGSRSGTDKVNLSGFDTFDPNIDDFFEFGLPSAAGKSAELSQFRNASRMCNWGLLIMNDALNASRSEARTAHFRAEKAEREVARLKDETVMNSLCEKELAAKEVRRAFRKGKMEVAEIVKNRFVQFTNEYGELKRSYQSMGEYRECQGTVGGLYLTMGSEYSFESEMAKSLSGNYEPKHELLLPDGVDVRRYPQFYILCLESYLFRQSGRIIYGLAKCGLVVMFIGTGCVWL
ncbi:hypothetical protein DY000_02030897 [Brassica cretica]|uniref:Uncharacterized protein n=1 Tax=Brassica cretica TaxID=69181 RepID=A0ABQ7DWJ6_BRACR|nr:hypothetical protein DY000_02030897 [Brassica cretica]